jgi:hypothetical protein
MTFFNYSAPSLRRKQLNLDVQDLEGIWYVQFPIVQERLYSRFYMILLLLVDACKLNELL